MAGSSVEHEVVVIGAGPTGLMAALELRRLGVPVTLVDRLEQPHRQSRATAVLPWTLELLEPSGATAAILEHAVRASGADVRAPDGGVLGGYHFDAVPSRYHFFAALPQWRTEQLLHERLEASGGTVRRGIAVTGLEEAGDHVDVHLERAAGTRERWRAQWVIAATGPDSTVRHALHEQLVGGEYPHRYTVADVKVDAALDPHRTAVFIGDAGVAALLVLPDSRRLAVLDHDDSPRAPVPDLAEVQSALADRVTMPCAISDLTWSSCFTLHHRVVPRMASERVFLAGDAAHLSSLFGAFGMNGGLQDSVNLAWKLARVHEGRSRAALLETYEPERHADATKRVAMAGAMHEGVVGRSGSTPTDDPEGRHEASAFPSDPDAANLARCMLDVQYPAGLDVAEGAGARFELPDVVVRRDRYGLFLGSGVDRPRALVERWRDTVSYVDDHAVTAGAVLVRPDGIVGWSAAEVGDRVWSALDARLAALHVPG